jgi:hypothetical protein
MNSPQNIKNTAKITYDISSIIMRNRAIMMVKSLKEKQNKQREKEYKKAKMHTMSNKFCIGFCENPLNCSCFINNSI